MLHYQFKSIFLSSNSGNSGDISLPYQDDILNNNHFINDVNDEGAQVVSGIQHIGFKLNSEEFLLPMSWVREIIMLPTVTYVPKAPFLVEGIVALRGEIMPVLNLRRYLHFEKGKVQSTTRVIIMQSDTGGFGVIVDDITEFVRLQSHEVETIPQNFFPPEYKILFGVSRIGNKIRGVLDINKIVYELTSFMPKEVENEKPPSNL